MKYLIAVIQPSRLEAVKEALKEVDVTRMTVSDVQGYGRQFGHKSSFLGREYDIKFVRKVKIEIALNDEFVKPAIEAILKAARTGNEGKIGDGKIFVLPLEEVVRIRTGETGREAI